jgi:hypothetical protein
MFEYYPLAAAMQVQPAVSELRLVLGLINQESSWLAKPNVSRVSRAEAVQASQPIQSWRPRLT